MGNKTKIIHFDEKEFRNFLLLQETLAVSYANQLANEFGKIKISDIASGPNEFNPLFLKEILSLGIDFEFVASDISPTYMVEGYLNLTREIPEEAIKKVKFVLADGNNLQKDITRTRLYENKWPWKVKLVNILKNSKYSFLRTGYNGIERIENYEDNSFHLALGQIPFTSMQNFTTSINEQVRILTKKGVHIVYEREVYEINYKRPRTKNAMKGAKTRYIEMIKKRLDQNLKCLGMIECVHPFLNDEGYKSQIVQYGDLVRDVILIHQKI